MVEASLLTIDSVPSRCRTLRLPAAALTSVSLGMAVGFSWETSGGSRSVRPKARLPLYVPHHVFLCEVADYKDAVSSGDFGMSYDQVAVLPAGHIRATRSE